MTKLIFAVLLGLSSMTSAQTIYEATSSKILFFAGTPVEDIDAENTKALSFLNMKTGEVTISIPNKAFHFKRALMEEHFNENYMETEKFPKSEFKGRINEIEKLDFNSGEPFTITVTGMLTIHGVSRSRTITVTVQGDAGKFEGKTTFDIALADHNIDRPRILWEKLAESVSVTADFTYEPYKRQL